VLEAAYEATLCAAIVNARTHGTNKVFLTLLGGGVFGNDTAWILGALQRAVRLYQQAALDVAIVSYGASQPAVHHLVQHVQHETP
jgi:O-acetyl-ADP-ribose deacetylase (regulator of RNase III)